jgi:amidase
MMPTLAPSRWFSLAVLATATVHSACATWLPAAPAAALVVPRASTNASALPDLYEASVVELQAGLDAGAFTSVDLVRAYFKRIAEVNHERAGLRAVLETNPSALFEAQALDEERAFFGKRGPLHGIPVLIKDNIATIYAEGASPLSF